MKKNNFLKSLVKIGIPLLVIAIALYIFYKCPFEYVLGIPCPGCGMTRALISCLKLDFKAAFYFHPLFPLAIIIAILYIMYLLKLIKPSKKARNTVLYIACFIFIIVYFIRMFTGSDIVNIHFKESLIYKFFSLFS